MAWDYEEYEYCCGLVLSRGDDKVGRDPKTVACYLRLQASSAFRASDYVASARLGTAATAINEDARNNHLPAWDRAADIMEALCTAHSD